MPAVKNISKISILDAGISYPVSPSYIPSVDRYVLYVEESQSGVLSANVDITGTPDQEGLEYVFVFDSDIDLNGNSFDVFGQSITQQQISTGCIIIARDTGTNFIVNVVPNFIDKAVELINMSTGSVDSDQIVAAAVENVHMGANAIATANIQDGAVTGPKLADNAVTTIKLADGTITTIKIADLAITSAKVASSAITEDKVSALAITAAKLATGAVSSDKLAVGAVTETKIGTGSVTTLKLADGAVTALKAAGGIVTDIPSIKGSFETGEQATNPIKVYYDGYVSGCFVVVLSDIEPTQAGTIVPKNNAGTSMTLSAPLDISGSAGDSFYVDITGNNTFSTGDVLTYTTAKTTAGGTVMIFPVLVATS